MIDYDWEKHRGTGKRKRHANGTIDTLRPKQVPPPCSKCPKESPEKEQEHKLSERNRKLVRLFREVKATNGARLTEGMKRDQLLMTNLAIIGQLYETYERNELADMLAARIIR